MLLAEAVTPDSASLLTWLVCAIFLWGCFREGLNGLKFFGLIKQGDAPQQLKKLDEYVHTHFHRVNGELHRLNLSVEIVKRDVDDGLRSKVEAVERKLDNFGEKLDSAADGVSRLDERTTALISKVNDALARRPSR